MDGDAENNGVRAATAERTPEASPGGASPVTARAVLIGLVGAALVAVAQMQTKVGPPFAPVPVRSTETLLTGVVLLLFVLALLNGFLRRFAPGLAFRPGELAVVYGLTTVGASIAAWDEVQFLLPMYTFPFRASQDGAMGPYRPYIPEWLVAQDPRVLLSYQQGRDSLWRAENLRAWAVPVLAWMVWLTVTGAVMWSWAVLFRRRWVEHDRLAFPCVQLPLEICRNGGFGGLTGGRLFWLGFAVAALIETLGQLSAFFPGIPAPQMSADLTPDLNTVPRPWNALAPMTVTFGMLHFGIAYLVPTEILFSGWFFYVLRKLGEVGGYALGWRELGWDAKGFPYTRAQSAGAWAMLFVLLVWAERKRIGRALLAALDFSRRPALDELDDDGEPGSYRLAGLTLILGSVFLVGWSVAAGMSLKLAVLYYAFFWTLTVTMTRIYAQVGPPILELYFLDPQKALTTALGTLGESPESLTHFSLLYWINRDHRGQPMAHQLVALQLPMWNGIRGNPLRSYALWIVPAFAVGALACLLTYLHHAHALGEDFWPEPGHRQSGAGAAIGRLREWVEQPKGPAWIEVGFMAFGAAFTVLLAKVNATFIGTPFHPIGYALAVCFAVEYNWIVFLVVWAVKAAFLRYGGLKLYLRFVPLAFGLTLGGIVTPTFWGMVAWFGGVYR
jgi:hypothetical protein